MNCKTEVQPEEHPVALIESFFNKSNREKMVEIMFETFTTPATYVSSSSVLTLYASCTTTGLSVNCGGGICSVVPFYKGHIIENACFQLKLGGRDLTDYLVNLLMQKGHNFSMETACDIKEKLCYVALNQPGATQTVPRAASYQLPDRSSLSTRDKCAYMCPELLFQPQLLGLTSTGIHEMVHNSIMKCNEYLRKDLLADIIVAWGSTMFPGFVERLENELTQLFPSNMRVKVQPVVYTRESSWAGGSILAACLMRWISKQEYEETGLSIVHK